MTKLDTAGGSLVGLTLVAVAMLVSFLLPGVVAPVVFALLSVIFPFLLIALGACRGGRLGSVRWPLLLLVSMTLASVVALLWLAVRVEPGPRWLGLPSGVAIQLLGLGLLPLVVSSLGYALTFDRWGLRESDLQQLRRRFGKRCGSAEGDGPAEKP